MLHMCAYLAGISGPAGIELAGLLPLVNICRWVPVYIDKEKTLCVMSIAFLLKQADDPIVWRGPKKTGVAFALL
jgi:hypothetical protein